MSVPARAASAALVALALTACGGDAAEQGDFEGPRPVVVEVTTLGSEDFREMADLLGELQPSESVLVRTEIDGVLDGIEFDEGQSVAAGTVLFRLRDREQVARLREAEARLALAEAEFGRTQRLKRRDAASDAEFERDRAELEVAKAEVELAGVELERTRVRAPFDGVVGVKRVSPGARVEPDIGLVRIDAIDPLELAFPIPEGALRLVRKGADFELTVASYPGRSFPGTVSFIAPNVDTNTRRVLIKGLVPNPDGALLPGMFARVEAELGRRQAFLLPEEAVVSDREGPFVWRIDADDEAERVPVELGARAGGRVEIRTGVREGDRVVTAGTHKLREGSVVRSVEAPAVADSEPDAPPSAAAPSGGDA
ncbi:MAG: efflux RND transporter periplasmic adaptor subunit [Myxococcota bacterium]|nr:efflux RND transporter periplasmic adaptor subunit [Myxococcota bacterium]